MNREIRIAKVAPTPGGAWEAGKSYDKLTLVTHNHDGWWSLQKNIDQEPVDGSSFWTRATDFKALIDALNDALSNANAGNDKIIENEVSRVIAEAARVAAEKLRDTNEKERIQAETERKANETERTTNETERQEAEEQRKAAEDKRKADYETNIKLAEQATAGANKAAQEALKQATAAQTAAQTANKAADDITKEFAQEKQKRVQDFSTQMQNQENTFQEKEAERDAANAAALQSAEKLSALERKTGEVKINTPKLIAGYVNGENGTLLSSTVNKYTDKINVENVASVRFEGLQLVSGSSVNAGYAFYDSDDNCVGSKIYNKEGSVLTKNEYKIDVPEVASYLRITVRSEFADTFYCYILDKKSFEITKADKSLVDNLSIRFDECQKKIEAEEKKERKTVTKDDGTGIITTISKSLSQIVEDSVSGNKVYYWNVKKGEKISFYAEHSNDLTSELIYGFTTELPKIGVRVTDIVYYSKANNVHDFIVCPNDGYFVVKRNTGYFLNNFAAYTITTAWSNKADKANTIAGYGIEDAMTTDEVLKITDKLEKGSNVPNEVFSIGNLSQLNRQLNIYVKDDIELVAGKKYTVKLKGERPYAYALRLCLFNDKDSITTGNIVKILSSHTQNDSPFSDEILFTATEDTKYIGLHLQSGGNAILNVFSLYDYIPISEYIKNIKVDDNKLNNEHLAFAAKKRFLTTQEQKDAGLVSDSDSGRNNNNITSLMQIVHITDSHGDWKRVKRAFDFSSKIGSTLCDSGDMINGYNSSTTESNDYKNYVGIVKDYTGKYVNCIGNHETWVFAGGSGNPASLYSTFIEPFIADKGWNIPSDSATYYHYDDEQWKIRYISINKWHPYACSSTTKSNYSQQQIDWFIATLLSTPADYGVIVLIHDAVGGKKRIEQYDKFYQKIDLSGHLEIGEPTGGGDIISMIIDAFIAKDYINISQTDGDNSTLNVSANFGNVESNEFICYICGHTHRDQVRYANSQHTQLILCSTCTNAGYEKSGNYQCFSSDLARVDDTETQDAFNVYTIDRVKGWVKIVRIGADMPFDFSERRDYMLIPYK